jgi:4-amino-4-deoxy-L-arabinose transferase-like glycosyltransferase
MTQDQDRPMLRAVAVVAGLSGLAALILLGIQLPADPAIGVTASDSPFTDEGWYVLGARNLALLGRLATDDWQLAWATLPFTLVVTAAFELLDVGIVQARVVSVVCSVAAIGVVTGLVTRRLGTAAGIAAGIAMATSSLMLFYGRLAILEPMVALFLTAGVVLLLSRATDRPLARGVAAGAAFALAIGTKPSAALAVTGIIVGVVVAGRLAVPRLGPRAVAAVGTIAAVGAAWVLVVIPQPGVLDSILRIWAVQAAPASATDVWQRVIDYVGESDRAIPMTAPLLVGSMLGIGLIAVRWRSLDPGRRALAGAAIGWIAFGMATLLVASYRPSRYVVPMLPAMAILTGLAVALAVERLRPARAASAVATVALCIGVAVPGVRDVVGWTAGATYRLPQIQVELLGRVADGHAIEGAGGPTFAMRVPVPAIVARPGLNDGDLYATHGVRWLLADPQARPAWAADHPDAWEARERIACYPWPSGEACLIRIP